MSIIWANKEKLFAKVKDLILPAESVLKRDVFKERVFYPWARDSKNRLEKIEQEKRISMGYVTE